MNKLRAETIKEIGDYLDSLSEIQVHNICRRVALPDLVKLSIALRTMKSDTVDAIESYYGIRVDE